jgi:hypothetical protein
VNREDDQEGRKMYDGSSRFLVVEHCPFEVAADPVVEDPIGIVIAFVQALDCVQLGLGMEGVDEVVHGIVLEQAQQEAGSLEHRVLFDLS